MSKTSEDLPAPDGPTTAVIPRSNDTSTDRRLCSAAPSTTSSRRCVTA
ncbi:hypothetical protein [Actinosynnema sp. NPDC020468]